MRQIVLRGTVVHGDGRGRQLGFPTANIKVEGSVLPEFGVYEVEVASKLLSRRRAVCNVGRRPTIEGSKDIHVEVHIPDFSGDLYGQRLTVAFSRRLRGEKKFDSLDDLKAQIREDVAALNRTPWSLFAALGAAVAIAYGLTLAGPFVIDDIGFVRDNAVFRLPFGDFLRALFSADYFRLTGERTYQPLVTFLHYFIHASPLACRASGLLIHAFNAVLVFLLCRKLRAGERSSFLAALLFALFPASTEAVNVSAFKGHTLSFTFSAASLLLWSSPQSLIFYALALLSKETALIVPVFAATETFFRPAPERKRRIAPLLGIAALTAAYLAVRLLILAPAPMMPLHYSPLSSLSWYLKMFLAPSPLCLAHGTDLAPAPMIVLPLLFFAGLLAERRRVFNLACLSWILISLLPVLHLVPFREFNPVSDRYLYMASAGFCALAARTLWRPRGHWLLYGVIAAWGILTLRRNALYLDPGALYEQTAACAPDVPQAQTLLGDFDLSAGDFAGARESYRKALLLDSRQSEALENVGVAEFMSGDAKNARRSLERAAGAEPRSSRANFNLGRFYASEGQTAKARSYYEKALKLDPSYAPARAALNAP